MDKASGSLILITNLGNHYTSKIDGLNTKIDSTVSIFEKVKQKYI